MGPLGEMQKPQEAAAVSVAPPSTSEVEPNTVTFTVQHEPPEDDEDDGVEADEEDYIEDFFSSYSDNHMNMQDTVGPTKFFNNWFQGFDQDHMTDLKTASSFAQDDAGSLDEAVMKSREMVDSIGSMNSGHGNVPIRPMGVPEKRAAQVAQSMIERMSNIEDDETRMQDEFKYETKRLMKLQLNPMRGVQSAKVGRSKAPISIFLDYSGSCGHVTGLFGLIMVGFANEGATILIGGNGVVNAVYHPFANRPLQHYADDIRNLSDMEPDASVRAQAGYITRCPGSNLQDLTVGPLIACTDYDSYQALMARPSKSTHVVLALEPKSSRNVRSVQAQGLIDITTDPKNWWSNLATNRQKQTGLNIYTRAQNLALHQILYLAHDLETLTDVLRSSR